MLKMNQLLHTSIKYLYQLLFLHVDLSTLIIDYA